MKHDPKCGKLKRVDAKRSERSTGIKFQVSPEATRRVADEQRTYLRMAADQIETSKSLDGLDAEFLAVVLRGAADRIGTGPTVGPGAKPKFDHGAALVQYALLRKTMDEGEATRFLAVEHDVSDTAMRNLIQAKGQVALSIFPVARTRFLGQGRKANKPQT